MIGASDGGVDLSGLVVVDVKPAAPLVGGCWRRSMAECLLWTASGRVSGLR